MAKSRAAYRAGTMTEPVPGVWRLRVMTDREQAERTLPGCQRAARSRETRAVSLLWGARIGVVDIADPGASVGRLLGRFGSEKRF